MSSIDSLLHIVVFAALFSSSSIFVVSAYPNPRRIETRIFYDPIEDPNSYLRFKARIGETIDVPLVCAQQSKEVCDKFAVIYRVESREFENCANKSDVLGYIIEGAFECEGSRPSQTAKFALNLANSSPNPYDVEEGKEYYFISATGPRKRVCEGFFILFSITVEARKQRNDERLSDDEDL